MTANVITIDPLAYLTEEEIKQEARAAVRQHFSREVEKSNLPYKIMYEAVRDQGLDFSEIIHEKIDRFRKEESTFTLTDSSAFKEAMKKIIEESKQALKEKFLQQVDALDTCDLQYHLSNALISVIKGVTK